MSLSRGMQFILFFVLALVLTRVPYINAVLEWYNTFFHELSHGLGAYITGGNAFSMELRFDGSGRLMSGNSVLPSIVTFSGYFGAILWGAGIYLIASKAPTVSNKWALVLAAIVFLSVLLWMRDWVSWVITAVLILSFLAIWRFAQLGIARFCLQLIGLYLIASGIASAWLLFGHDGHNDAVSMANKTRIPASIWIIVWVLSGLAALWVIWKIENRASR